METKIAVRLHADAVVAVIVPPDNPQIPVPAEARPIVLRHGDLQVVMSRQTAALLHETLGKLLEPAVLVEGSTPNDMRIMGHGA